jgi:hypothetical protein
MTKGPCAMRGLLHGPLGLNSLRMAGGESARGTRDGLTEVLLDGHRHQSTP